MNSNKTNMSKLAKYFLLANLLILIAGIVVLCVLGFNVDPNSQYDHILLAGVLSVMITLAISLIYVGIRYGFANGFSALLVAVQNVLLSTALICIIRIPVAETMLMALALLVGLSVIFSLILFDKFDSIHTKKSDVDLSIKLTLKDGIKTICTFVAIVVATMLLCLIFESASMMNLAREFFVMAIVLIYSMLTTTLPTYCFFSKRIRKKAKTKVDASVENQKIVLATSEPEASVPEQGEVNQGSAKSK